MNKLWNTIGYPHMKNGSEKTAETGLGMLHQRTQTWMTWMKQRPGKKTAGDMPYNADSSKDDDHRINIVSSIKSYGPWNLSKVTGSGLEDWSLILKRDRIYLIVIMSTPDHPMIIEVPSLEMKQPECETDHSTQSSWGPKCREI